MSPSRVAPAVLPQSPSQERSDLDLRTSGHSSARPTTVVVMAMCEACAALEAGDRQGAGHPGLAEVGGQRPMANGPLRADEQDYECRVCGTKWMHETGNAGFGWVEQ